ncbi:hypothetical protein [Paracoccus sp. 22332]|uniref:hypothetical protein n=1 Tax=Paracoccus sp. 22332 TaxID=3453913 RepID=UPI003F849EC3
MTTNTPAQVAVKPLEWRIWKHGRFEAESIFGLYQTWSGHFRKPGEVRGNRCEDPEAAAQADYEARIRSAVIPAPAPAEQEPVAWRVRVKSDDPEEWSLLPAGGGADYLDRKGYECQPLYTHPAPVPAVPDDVAELVARLRKRSKYERDIQANNVAVAELLQPQIDAFNRRDGTHNLFALRLALEHKNCAENDGKLAEDWDAAIATIEAQAAELARLKGLLEEAREWNWIDFEEAKKAGDEVEAFLPHLCRLDAEIAAALAKPTDASNEGKR